MKLINNYVISYFLTFYSWIIILIGLFSIFTLLLITNIDTNTLFNYHLSIIRFFIPLSIKFNKNLQMENSIIICNHKTFWDHFIILFSYPSSRFCASKSRQSMLYAFYPLFYVMNKLNFKIFDKGNSFEKIKKWVIQNEQTPAFFSQGGRYKNEIKNGAFEIAKQCNKKIYILELENIQDFISKSGIIKKPGTINIKLHLDTYDTELAKTIFTEIVKKDISIYNQKVILDESQNNLEED